MRIESSYDLHINYSRMRFNVQTRKMRIESSSKESGILVNGCFNVQTRKMRIERSTWSVIRILVLQFQRSDS